MTDKHTLVERLEYTAEHGIFCASTAGMLASYSEAANRITALEAEKAEMVKAMRYILPYLEWTIGKESPGHHPTMPSAVAEFRATLAKHQEGEGK